MVEGMIRRSDCMVQGSVGRSVCMVQGRTRRSVCESKTQQNSNSMSSRQRDGLFVSKGGLRVSRWRRRCCFVVLSLTCNGHDVQEEGCIVATACLLACLLACHALSRGPCLPLLLTHFLCSGPGCLLPCACTYVYVGMSMSVDRRAIKREALDRARKQHGAFLHLPSVSLDLYHLPSGLSVRFPVCLVAILRE